MAIQIGIIRAVLENDDSTLRFERFCNEICSEAFGVELVSTSRTRDLGRDGRSISSYGVDRRAFLCATLEKEIDQKFASDISRLAQTTKNAEMIIYCTSKALSEEKCNKIESTIRKLHPSVESVEVLGQYQLTDLAQRHETIIRRHYSGEINSIEQAILGPSTAPEAKDVGLRLALLAHASDDASLLRKELAIRLVLDTLQNKGPLTPKQVAVEITALLHLPRAVSTNYTRELFNELKVDGLIYFEDSKANLSDSGMETAKTVPEEAGTKLLEGRLAVREAIKSLSGHILSDMQFEKLWNTFQDGITLLFYSHGLALVKMIRSALAEEQWSPEKSQIKIPMEAFAARVAESIEEQQLKEEIRQSIIDMFSERDSAAFKWLTQVCGIYVMMCTLGFETLSNEQILKSLSCYHLVPDSDIVLSLLCVGEENHADVERILAGWKSIGGKLFMARPILEEVAYHAWISDYDYEAFGDRLTVLSDKEARRLIDNAFVRAFRREAGDLTSRQYWNNYIKQYRGRSALDYAYVLDHLRGEYGFGLIAEPDEANKDFTDKIYKFLITFLCKQGRCQPDKLNSRLLDKASLVYL